MTKTTTFTIGVLCGFVLLAVAALTRAPGPGATSMPAAMSQPVLAAEVGFSVLPDGRGGTNVESVVYPEAMGFDKKRSLEAFKGTVYPLTERRFRVRNETSSSTPLSTCSTTPV